MKVLLKILRHRHKSCAARIRKENDVMSLNAQLLRKGQSRENMTSGSASNDNDRSLRRRSSHKLIPILVRRRVSPNTIPIIKARDIIDDPP